MKLALAACDHFHLLNQARILLRDGYLDAYYATRIRNEIEGIPAERARQCLAIHYALRVWQRNQKLLGGAMGFHQICKIFDLWLKATVNLSDIDALVVLSGFGLQSFRKARKHGIGTIVDCGSTHPAFQHRVVFEEFKRNGIQCPLFPENYRNRVIKEFAEADYVLLPSKFVMNTFIEEGFDAKKILHAPYGVAIETFRPKASFEQDVFRVICPSGVNLRKGARILVEAWRKLSWKNAELHWVGMPGLEAKYLFRHPLPGCIFHSFMSHEKLSSLYRKCDVFTLPSFEEGFARVMLEAAASGLPLIVTPNTGAEDFFSADDPEGWLIPTNNVDALCEALIEAKSNRDQTFSRGQKAAVRAQSFSWEAYGDRVIAHYKRVFGG